MIMYTSWVKGSKANTCSLWSEFALLTVPLDLNYSVLGHLLPHLLLVIGAFSNTFTKVKAETPRQHKCGAVPLFVSAQWDTRGDTKGHISLSPLCPADEQKLRKCESKPNPKKMHHCSNFTPLNEPLKSSECLGVKRTLD